VVGNESSTHPSYFQLEGILDEGSSDEIIVLSFEAFIIAPKFMDRIIFVQFPILDIIPDGAGCSGFDFKHEGVTILVHISTINLRAEKKIIVDQTVSIVVLFLLWNNSSLNDLFDIFSTMG